MTPRGVLLGMLWALLLPVVACSQDSTKPPPPGVRIGLNYNGAGGKPGIVILPIESTDGDSLGTMISRDLDFSDRVILIALDSTVIKTIYSRSTGRISYPLLAKFGATALIRGAVTPGGLRISVYDVAGKRRFRTADFALPKGNRDADWRFAVHGISDEIEHWLLGSRGMAQTRIAFVHEGVIKVVDSDGAETRTVRAGSGSLSPAWSADGRHIVYSVLGDLGTEIMDMNLITGVARRISGSTPSLNITPVFAPDGKTIVYSHGVGEGSDLISVDTAGIRHLTIGNGSDNNSPSFSPDGRQVAFVSDRSGQPQIYIMDADGTNMQLLAGFDLAVPSYRSSPDWSPSGSTIAYQQRAGDFQVWMIDVRDRVPTQLTMDGENEDPSWAPDGRHVVITSTRGGTKQLWVLDTESGRYRQLTHNAGARLSAWSPILIRRTPPLVAAP